MIKESKLTKQSGITHHFGGDVYARQGLFKAGESILKHIHTYDHLSILASGKVIVKVDGVDQIITAPHCLVVKAGKEHMVTAIEDSVWFCVHHASSNEVNDLDGVKIGA